MKKILNVLALLGLLVPGLLAQTPPVIGCPQPVTVEATSSNGAMVTLTASVSDVDSNALTLVWMVDGAFSQTNDLAAGTTATPVDVTFSAVFGLGTHEVVVLVSDGGAPVSCTNQVTVVDTTPPTIQRVTATPSVLWPPNHKMRPIRITVEASDASGTVSNMIVSVTSSQPDNGTGDGDTAIDWAIGPGPLDLALRAERSGRIKSGRIYTITVQVTDGSGNSSTETVTVTVPHDQGKKAKPPKPKPHQKPKPKKGGKKK